MGTKNSSALSSEDLQKTGFSTTAHKTYRDTDSYSYNFAQQPRESADHNMACFISINS